MRAEEQFDSFYLKSRRALVHQTFALTGDLAAAQRAVRDSYVAAWHHWRKVKNLEDPRDWVRPRAWAQAQRRHTARLWQRTRDLSPDDRHVLDALHKLPVSERRALLIAHLAGLSVEESARELNLTQEAFERGLASAESKFVATLETEPDSIRAQLVALSEVASNATLPRPGAIRREGRNRRRTHLLIAAVAATFLAVGSGAFAYAPGGQAPDVGAVFAGPDADESSAPVTQKGIAEEQETTLPSADDLLTARQVRPLDDEASWKAVATHDNLEGEGLNYACQQERFADPEGLATLVRVLKGSRQRPVRSVVQAVEISETADDAAASYSTVLSWINGCEGGELYLSRAFDVDGLGDRASLFELESWGRPETTYTLLVSQVGQVVTTSAVRTVNSAPPRATYVAKTLGAATKSICERAGRRTDCAGRPKLEAIPPARSGEAPGVLATVDMPPLVGTGKPWVGTSPQPAGAPSPTCDRADFRKEGASRTRTRTFLLVPEARMPDRFGLTETYGTFKSAKDAAAFMRKVRGRFAKCEDKDLASELLVARSFDVGRLDGSIWRQRTELSESREVYYDVGFVRRGNAVAQVTFIPAGPVDMHDGDFRATVVRAGQRLAELDGSE